MPVIRHVAVVAIASLAVAILSATLTVAEAGAAGGANRLNYLDEFCEPFYPHPAFAKLTTPQWIGEAGVEAVVILTIEVDAHDSALQTSLKPVAERLNALERRVPLTVFTENADEAEAVWNESPKAGLTFEPTLVDRDGPLLSQGSLEEAKDSFDKCVDAFCRAGLPPTVFRAPGSGRFNSVSPRFYAEIVSGATTCGNFASMSNSVGHLFTPDDNTLPANLVKDENGEARFDKYVSPDYVTVIRNYPYPYVVGRKQWEIPLMLPNAIPGPISDAPESAVTTASMKAAVDLAVVKQGVAVLALRGGSSLDGRQTIEIIDHVAEKHGDKVRFLTFRDALTRLQQNLLGGQSLRTTDGQDNGVRLVDVNDDGYLDVIVGNQQLKQTRVWNPESREWCVGDLPFAVVAAEPSGRHADAGVRFGVLQENGFASALVRNDQLAGVWHWDDGGWQTDDRYLRGLTVDDRRVFTQQQGRDRGVRLRDVDNDGQCELIVGNETDSAVFQWSAESAIWKRMEFALPPNTSVVDQQGRDNGLRLVDINSDGFQDVVFSNREQFSLWLYIPDPDLFYEFNEIGWKRPVARGQRGEPAEIHMIVRGGDHPNNGTWFSDGHLYVHNEDTFPQPGHVLHLSPQQLIRGYVPPPLSPEESGLAIHVPEEFQVEVVAAEPLIVDPISMHWGEDGRLWVVEMRDYPTGMDGEGQPGGVVRVLEDVDRDGKYDRSTEFLEGLNFPTGVMPWRDGALVSAAPEIIFARDTDGDGRADEQKVLYEGFGLGNQQHRVNGFEYGLDNWVYAANGNSGGKITSMMTGEVVDIRGSDLRFRPDDGAFQAQAGVTEFGRHRDDWGNWFGNFYANWGFHFFMPIHYLDRNPHLAVAETDRDLAQYPGARRIFRRSRLLARPHMAQPLDQLTAPCSLTAYRDELFGDKFARTVFMCEVDKNIIRREILEPDGVTFTSHRSAEDEGREFLASTDNWFRPTQPKTGPDGALYVVDMYRLIIEHEGWYPDDLREILDFRAGQDRGRIYRIYPKGAALRKIPRLDQLDSAGLVAALDSPNGWQRDTAQRLLVHAGDQAAVEGLCELVRTCTRAKTRLQALCTLDGIGGLSAEIVLVALKDTHACVREHAVRVSEAFLGEDIQKTNTAPEIVALQQQLLRMVDDPQIRVRYQLAFSLGEWRDPRVAEALTDIARHDADNRHIQDAVLSAAPGNLQGMLSALLADRSQPPPAGLMDEWLAMAASLQEYDALNMVLSEIARAQSVSASDWRCSALTALLEVLARRETTLSELAEQAGGGLPTAVAGLAPVFAQAELLAGDAEASQEDRVLAIRLLSTAVDPRQRYTGQLVTLVQPDVPLAVLEAALANLSDRQDPRLSAQLLKEWPALGPETRIRLLDMLISRTEWALDLLHHIQHGVVRRNELGSARRQALLRHPDQSVSEQAEAVFGTVNEDRQEVLATYREVVGMTGDAVRGAQLYAKHCATCHQFREEGNKIAPALDAVADKPTSAIVQNILDPNREVDPAFIQYTSVTESGRVITGIIVGENSSSITIRTAADEFHTLLRNEVEEIVSSGVSLMPEGLERDLDQQAVADVIAWLKSDPPGP